MFCYFPQGHPMAFGLFTPPPSLLRLLIWLAISTNSRQNRVCGQTKEMSPQQRITRPSIHKSSQVKNDHTSLSSTTAIEIWIFIYTWYHFTPHGRYGLNKFTLLPMCGFRAQLVEHHTSIGEVTGWNPVEALIFFMLLSNCLIAHF